MKFKFKALKQNGEVYKGVRNSKDKFSLYGEIKNEGDLLLSATEISSSTKRFFKGNFSLLNSVPEHEIIIFAKNLGSMIESGLPMAKSLSVLERQTKNKKLASLIATIEQEIRKGKTLSEALSEYPKIFNSLFVSMVKAGEESGKISSSLKIVSEELDGIYKLKKKIRGAMIYPSVILSIMAVVGILMLIYVVPGITATFQDLHVELPFLTRFFISSSNFLKDNILTSLSGIIIFIFVIYYLLKIPLVKVIFESITMKLPVVGELIKETNSARLTRTLSSLLSSGVPFAESIFITSQVVQNSKFKNILNEARLKVEKGEPISQTFIAYGEICPIFVGEMMSVGEETGKLPEMMIDTAIFYENSVDQKTKDMSTIIEPVLMVIIGVGVGFFALAMIKPIYSIMDTI